jgi:hypothetical protein
MTTINIPAISTNEEGLSSPPPMDFLEFSTRRASGFGERRASRAGARSRVPSIVSSRKSSFLRRENQPSSIQIGSSLFPTSAAKSKKFLVPAIQTASSILYKDGSLSVPQSARELKLLITNDIPILDVDAGDLNEMLNVEEIKREMIGVLRK